MDATGSWMELQCSRYMVTSRSPVGSSRRPALFPHFELDAEGHKQLAYHGRLEQHHLVNADQNGAHACHSALSLANVHLGSRRSYKHVQYARLNN
jgi:hypothetical protein